MPNYRLHYFPESGNSYKLALMLTLCGQTFEPVWTDFGGGVTRTPEWRGSVNEMGEIPVLEEDGVRLTQTAPILSGAPEQYGRFGGATAERQIRSAALVVLGQSQADRLHGDLSLLADIHAIAGPACAGLSAQAPRRLPRQYSKQHLQRNAFAIGKRPTVADFSMIAYLSYPADETGYDFAASHPAVSAWLGRVAGLPGWRSAYDLLPGKRLTHYA